MSIRKLFPNYDVTFFINALQNYDDNLFLHACRMVQMANDLFNYADLNPEYREEILLGVFLHDVGKLQMPKHIINKEDALTDNEWEIIKLHPIEGLKLVNHMPNIIKDICLYHHEKLDGSGYPYGITNIPDYVQYATVLDIYDALSCKRSYKEDIYDKIVFEKLDEECKNNKINPKYVSLIKNHIFFQSMDSK